MGSINLCPKTPDSTQKELTQSDHLTLGKRPKRAEIVGYFVVVQNLQNLTTFWTFSQSGVDGLG